MFCFLFCSFLIKCVFLSHNVIWKQFLPTAGFAFTIGKHVEGRAGKTRRVTREPPPQPLGSRSEAYRGLRTSLIKPEDVFTQTTRTALPPPEGQRVLWGRHFLNASQIKLIRCRPDCQLPSSPGRMWRPAQRRLPGSHRHRGGVRADHSFLRVPQGASLRAKPTPCRCCHPCQ